MNLLLKYVFAPIVGLFVVILLYVFSSLLFFSEVEIDKYGIYSQWNIPLTPSFEIKTRLENGRFQVGDNIEHLRFFDGPVVTKQDDSHFFVQYYCNNKIYKEMVNSAITITCNDEANSFNFYEKKAHEKFYFEMPEKLVVVGDIHGRMETFKTLLSESGVIDANSKWQFGDGHLVLTGDALDRGRESIQVLWFIYNLQYQAEQAGGRVHFILGNHEHMVMTNDLRYVESGHRYAIEQMMPYAESLSMQTVLGQWLTEQPHVVKVGDMLFTHGGISPDIMKKFDSIESLNLKFIEWTKKGMSDEHYVQVAKDPKSPSWYRGYFTEAKMYPKITETELSEILSFFEVEKVVVGHTRQKQINQYFGGKLIAIDTMDVNPQALIIIDGEFHNVSISTPEELYEEKRTVKAFSLLNPNDRAFIANLILG